MTSGGTGMLAQKKNVVRRLCVVMNQAVQKRWKPPWLLERT